MVAVVPEFSGAPRRPSAVDSRKLRRGALRPRPRQDSPISALDPFSHVSIMALDVYRHSNEWCIELDVPGVDPSRIDVTATNGVLVVRAVRARRHPGAATLEFAEREHGAFSRELRVGDELDVGKRRVDYNRGVITISIPLRQEPVLPPAS